MVKPSELKKLFRLFEFITPYIGYFIGGMLMLFCTSSLFMAFPALAGEMANVANGTGKYGLSIQQIGFLFIIILVLQSVFSFTRTIFFAIVSEKGMADARKKVYGHIIGQHMEFYEKTRVGDLISRITADISQMQQVISVTLAEFLRQIITLIVGVVILLWLAPRLTGIMLAVLPFSVAIAVVFGRYIKQFSRKRQDKLAASNVIVDETLQSFSVVKSFGNESYELNRYSGSLQEIVKISLAFARVRGVFFVFLITILTGSIFYILYRGALLVQTGDMVVGDLFSFILYSGILAGAFASISNFYSTLSSAVGATERVMGILDNTPEIVVEDKVIASSFTTEGGLQIKNLEFTYPTREDVQVLKGINLNIKPGERVALVGGSGAGKSTIASILLRFYPEYTGSILLDGKDIRDIALVDYRSVFGIVPQEIILFGGSIGENIAYGRPGASESEIIEAAKVANAWEFIDSFPDGLDTIVGERGIKLSGGQRQRVAIARAVLRDPAILILDEATSSLDAESESLVQEALQRVMENRTSIVIAHRLSTIRDVDCIYVLQNGRVAEEGTHDELVQIDNGIYRNLTALQLQEIS